MAHNELCVKYVKQKPTLVLIERQMRSTADEAPASERGELLWTRRDYFFSRANRDGEHTPRKKQKKPLEQAGFLDYFHTVGYCIYQYR